MIRTLLPIVTSTFLLLASSKACCVPNLLYQAMTPQSVVLYQQLKHQESAIVAEFKKTYPRIPESMWHHLHSLEQLNATLLYQPKTQNQIPEPHVPHNYTKEQLKSYCHAYLRYELQKQGVDPTKIRIEFKKLTDALGVAGSNLGTYYTVLGSHCSDYHFSISDFVITFDIDAAFRTDLLFLQQAMKHEIAHLTEAHSPKCSLIRFLVEHYYGSQSMQSETYRALIHKFNQHNELVADLLPSLLSLPFAHKYHAYVHKHKAFHHYDGLHASFQTRYSWTKQLIAHDTAKQVYTPQHST